MALKNLGGFPTPKGMKKVYCRYRKVPGNPNKILDAHDYGYKAWCFLVPCKGS